MKKFLYSQLCRGLRKLPTWAQILTVVTIFLWMLMAMGNDEPKVLGEQVETYEAGSVLYPVSRVVDGDTIRVMIEGEEKVVRLVNVNAPESVDPRREVECMGMEASEMMKELAAGKRVRLEKDETQQDKDRYGRLLRFVFLEDGRDVGLEMIRLGYAQSTPYGSEPHVYLEKYDAAAEEAREAGLGLWGEMCE